MLKQLFEIPNLVSLSRIFLTPIVGYYLSLDNPEASWICIGLLLLAALTDGLDGYLARRMNKISRLGTALDPVADKIFAGVLVILLIIYRDFPIWIAAVVIGRDLLIMIAGGLAIKGRDISVPSNLVGKYTFASLVTLLGSYVIYFELGILITTWTTILFLILSTISYARVYYRILKNLPQVEFKDNKAFKIFRLVFNISFVIYMLINIILQYSI